jgi:Peptidase C39 family
MIGIDDKAREAKEMILRVEARGSPLSKTIGQLTRRLDSEHAYENWYGGLGIQLIGPWLVATRPEVWTQFGRWVATLPGGLATIGISQNIGRAVIGEPTPSEVVEPAIALGPAGASAGREGGRAGAMVRQLTENACGMACGQQLLKEAGVEVFQSNLTEKFYRGLTPETLAENLNRFLPGWRGVYTYLSASQFRGLASRGSFIARIGGNPGHFVIVDGVEAGMVLIRDPINGMSRVADFREFLDTVSGVVFR